GRSRGDVDDAAASTNSHTGDHGADDVPGAGDVDDENLVPVFGVEVDEPRRGRAENAGVVDEKVGLPQFASHRVDRALDLVELRHGRDEVGVQNRDEAPVRGKPPADRSADRASGAGHDRDGPIRRHTRILPISSSFSSIPRPGPVGTASFPPSSRNGSSRIRFTKGESATEYSE